MNSSNPIPNKQNWTAYHYTPKLGVSITFTTIFLFLAIVQFLWIFKSYMKFWKIAKNLVFTQYDDPESSMFERIHQNRKKTQLLRNSTNPEDSEGARNSYKSLMTIRTKLRYQVLCFYPLIIGNICEALGYIGRIKSHSNITTQSFYILQNILILVSPAFITATIYMIFGRLVNLLDSESYSLIKTKYLTTCFVTGDVISFLLQGTGAAVSGHKNMIKASRWIIMSGLIIQIICFGLFLIVELRYVYLSRINPTTKSKAMKNLPSKTNNWRTLNLLLIITSLVVMVRNIFRAIEYAQGSNGFIISKEVYLISFDSSLISLSSILFVVAFPSDTLLSMQLNKDFEGIWRH